MTQETSPRSYWFWMAPADNPARIVCEVAQKHALSLEELTGPSKRRPLAHARWEAMWELRQRTRLSTTQIARRLGRQDHTTAMHGIKEHERRRAQT